MVAASAPSSDPGPFSLAAYDYDLPPELIAQEPLAERAAARLLCLERAAGAVSHRRVDDLPDMLRAGDLLVLNDTLVMAARLRGATDTGAKVEALLVRETGPGVWTCLARPAKRLRLGRRVVFAGGAGATVIGHRDGRVTLEFERAVEVPALLDSHGEVPLPPYIERPVGPTPADRARYQTVYARVPGAIAAPTAGLHFTPAMLDRLRERGVDSVTLTLHVGPGTFLPVREADVSRHQMEPEWVDIPEATVAEIAGAKADGQRVIAAGTTTTRALESRACPDGALVPGAGWADRFILPGHEFRIVGGLLTNFHLPRSTLLMLVSAFAGRERILAAYRAAVARRYRFYSYGDAMLIL